METENKGTETNVVIIPAPEDYEAQIKKLEEERVNYQAAYLKEKAKNNENESEDDKMRRIAEETFANSRIADIARETDAIMRKALKENSEMKKAMLNKTDIPASTTTHTESQPVKDTMITPEQMAAFKAQGRSDKWIENYKRNLARNTR